MTPPSQEANNARTAAEASSGQGTHHLTLYIAGLSSRSRQAIVNTRRICEEYLPGRYELKIVDLCQDPHLAASEQIIAAPTLVKHSPEPVRRFVGDMSRTEVIVQRLGLADDGEDPFDPKNF